MTHPNDHDSGSSWDELARSLGLPPDSMGQPAPTVEPEEEPLLMAELVEDDLGEEDDLPVTAEVVELDEDAIEPLDEGDEPAEVIPPRRQVRPVEPVLTVPAQPLPWPSDDLDEEVLNAKAKFEASEPVEAIEAADADDEEAETDSPEAGEGATGEEAPAPGEGGRKRRRRRRRRGKKAGATPEGATAEAAPTAEVVATPPTAPRPAPAAPVVPLPSGVHVFRAPVEESEIEEPSELDTEDEVLYEGGQEEPEEDESLDILENWNVPSWQELVASLYRPER